MRRAKVNEIGSKNEMSMQIVELTKQVTLLTSQNVPTQVVCSTYGNGSSTYPFVFDSHVGLNPKKWTQWRVPT